MSPNTDLRKEITVFNLVFVLSLRISLPVDSSPLPKASALQGQTLLFLAALCSAVSGGEQGSLCALPFVLGATQRLSHTLRAGESQARRKIYTACLAHSVVPGAQPCLVPADTVLGCPRVALTPSRLCGYTCHNPDATRRHGNAICTGWREGRKEGMKVEDGGKSWR